MSKDHEFRYHDIVKRLIGEIRPKGETNTDNERYDNLLEMCLLAELLIDDIQEVSKEKDRHEYSIKRAGEYADTFLNRMKTTIEQ